MRRDEPGTRVASFCFNLDRLGFQSTYNDGNDIPYLDLTPSHLLFLASRPSLLFSKPTQLACASDGFPFHPHLLPPSLPRSLVSTPDCRTARLVLEFRISSLSLCEDSSPSPPPSSLAPPSKWKGRSALRPSPSSSFPGFFQWTQRLPGFIPVMVRTSPWVRVFRLLGELFQARRRRKGG